MFINKASGEDDRKLGVEQDKSPYLPAIQCKTIILLRQSGLCTDTSEKLSKPYQARDQENKQFAGSGIFRSSGLCQHFY